jgi:hypothetical protein
MAKRKESLTILNSISKNSNINCTEIRKLFSMFNDALLRDLNYFISIKNNIDYITSKVENLASSCVRNGIMIDGSSKNIIEKLNYLSEKELNMLIVSILECLIDFFTHSSRAEILEYEKVNYPSIFNIFSYYYLLNVTVYNEFKELDVSKLMDCTIIWDELEKKKFIEDLKQLINYYSELKTNCDEIMRIYYDKVKSRNSK